MAEINVGEVVVKYDEADLHEMSMVDLTDARVGGIVRTDEGYMVGKAPVAKVGVMKYVRADGTTMSQFVPSTTLFDAASMTSLKMKPITNLHPADVLVDSKSVKRYKVGSTGETVERDGDYLTVSVSVMDSDAIECVEAGRRELSPGYRAWVVDSKGVYEGVEYDSIQVRRSYNHLALCDRARGGPDLRLNIDSVDGFELKQTEGVVEMPKKVIDGTEYEASQEMFEFTDSLIGKFTSEKERMQAVIDQSQAEIAALKAVNIADDIKKGVKERIALLRVADAVLVGVECDALENVDIMKKIVTAKFPEAKLDDKSAEYIQARVDGIVDSLKFDPDAIARQRFSTGSAVGDSMDVCEKAKAESEARILDGYKNLKNESEK